MVEMHGLLVPSPETANCAGEAAVSLIATDDSTIVMAELQNAAVIDSHMTGTGSPTAPLIVEPDALPSPCMACVPLGQVTCECTQPCSTAQPATVPRSNSHRASLQPSGATL